MISTDELSRIFTLQTGKPYIKSRESSTLEFKKSFHHAGLVEYIKEFAAFANHSGGYIVFGVQDRPHIPIGLQNDQFITTGEEIITQLVNQYFNPTLEWEKDIYVWNNINFGIFYVHESRNKPIVAIQDGGKNQEIKNGEIYYRYVGRTEKIHYAELVQIIEERITRERETWQDLFRRIAAIGPENVAILDTMEGRIEKGDRHILIDDELIPKLKFIREGQFKEKAGAITLRLIGDIIPISVVGVKEKIIQVDQYRLRATDVAEQVSKGINKHFSRFSEHIKCWKYYKIREVNDEGQVSCNPKYCEYKEAFHVFMYTQEWVDLLISELLDHEKYKKIISVAI